MPENSTLIVIAVRLGPGVLDPIGSVLVDNAVSAASHRESV